MRFFFKLVANDRSDKRFLLTSKFCPLGLSAPDLWLYTIINHEKMCLKSEVEEILFKLATIVMRPSCWHQNFGPNGFSGPTLGLCLNFFSSIMADFNMSKVSDTGQMVLWFKNIYRYNIVQLLLKLAYLYLEVRLAMACVFGYVSSVSTLVLHMLNIVILYLLKETILNHDTRKPVFGVSDQVRLKPACWVVNSS